MKRSASPLVPEYFPAGTLGVFRNGNGVAYLRVALGPRRGEAQYVVQKNWDVALVTIPDATACDAGLELRSDASVTALVGRLLLPLNNQVIITEPAHECLTRIKNQIEESTMTKKSNATASTASAKKPAKSPSPDCSIPGPHPIEDCEKTKTKLEKFAAVTVPAAKPERASSKAMREGAKVQKASSAAPKKSAKKVNGAARTNKPRISDDVVFTVNPKKIDPKLQKKLDNAENNSHGTVVLRYLAKKGSAKYGKLVSDVVAGGKYSTSGNANALILGDLRILQTAGVVSSDEASA